MDMTDRMRAVIASVLKVSPSDVSSDASQLTLGAWDSVAHMRLILALESEFEVAFEPDEIASLTSVAAIRAYLERNAPADA